MKKYLSNNLLLLIYSILHSTLITVLNGLNIKPNFIIIIVLGIIILNCILQANKDLIFNVKNMRIYYLILSIVNSAISSLIIFTIRTVSALIVCKGINSASLMDLSWFSLFLLGGFLMMLIFNYIAYEVINLFKNKK
ncbi:MAG: hypothetical protein IKT40_05200 [Bacilli bacterium]|nr:hypothetical protein [Bacilli bacterium]